MCDCVKPLFNSAIPPKNFERGKGISNLPFQQNIITNFSKSFDYNLRSKTILYPQKSLNKDMRFNAGPYLKLKNRKELWGSQFIPRENYDDKYSEKFRGELENSDFLDWGKVANTIDYTMKNGDFVSLKIEQNESFNINRDLKN